MNTNWIVIPVYSNVHLLRNAVESALAQDIGNIKLFLVNNSPPGDSVTQYLRTLQGLGHTVVTFYPQLGVAGAWNYALEYIFAQGSNRALVINQDVELVPSTYRILEATGRPFVTAVSVKDKTQLRNHVISPEHRPHPDFSCFLIREWMFKRVGKFDEAYWPAYAEDADYHVRMHRAGIRACCIDIPFYHVGAGTMKEASTAARSGFERWADKNRDRFLGKYGARIGVPEEYDELFTEDTFGIK